MVQFLKRGDWLKIEVWGLLKGSIYLPQGAETLFYFVWGRGRLFAEIKNLYCFRGQDD